MRFRIMNSNDCLLFRSLTCGVLDWRKRLRRAIWAERRVEVGVAAAKGKMSWGWGAGTGRIAARRVSPLQSWLQAGRDASFH